MTKLGRSYLMNAKTEYEKYEEDKNFKRLMRQEDLIMAVTESFCGILEYENITRSELAKLMGKTKGYISQILSGGRNITLRSLSDIANYLGYTVKIDFKRKKEKQQNTYQIDWDFNSEKIGKSEISIKASADDYNFGCQGVSRLAS